MWHALWYYGTYSAVASLGYLVGARFSYLKGFEDGKAWMVEAQRFMANSKDFADEGGSTDAV
jgi:hypothetical protein